MTDIVNAACIAFPDGMVHWCESDPSAIKAAIKAWKDRNPDIAGPRYTLGVITVWMPSMAFLHAQAMNEDQLADVDEDVDPGALNIVEDSDSDMIEIEGVTYPRDLFRQAKKQRHEGAAISSGDGVG